MKESEKTMFLRLFRKLSSLPFWLEIPIKIGLGFAVLSWLMSYEDFSESHSGSIAELYGKLLLIFVWVWLSTGIVIGLPVVLFIFIIRKIPFFDSWRQGWVSIFRSKE